MRTSMKRLFCLLALVSWYFFIPFDRIHAVGEFLADYDVAYSVSPSGTTFVTQNVTLTNNLTNLYPQQYSILLDTDKIRNITASDRLGSITPLITQSNGKTEIRLKFNEEVAGLGKKLTFTLRFENLEIAQKNGTIWEINIPGVPSEDLGQYNVSLHVPPSFGPNAYLTPLPAKAGLWTKDQMIQGGISGAYGQQQISQVDLSYYIENTGITSEKTEIALPPDTAYQRVVIESLDPKPITIDRDKDGNWLAQYQLHPKASLTVEAKLIISVALTARPEYGKENINTADYLRSTRFWESSNPRIVSLSQQYRNPRQIYDYIVSALSYDDQGVNKAPTRKGAVEALGDPKHAICMEFTDLFVAMARSAGIPAREVVGYAYTTNAKLRPLSLVADVLHAWPEYYDQQSQLWVPVDPTWARTTGGINYFDKLDFNHIVFAIHGEEDNYPYPAGFYKKSGSSSKDVQVRFSDVVPNVHPAQLTTHFLFPNIVSAGITASGTVEIQNTSGVSANDAVILIQSDPGNYTLTREVAHILPFTTISLPVRFRIADYFLNSQGTLLATVNGETTQYTFSIKPVYGTLLPVIAVAGCLVALLWFFSRRFLWRIFRKY